MFQYGYASCFNESFEEAALPTEGEVVAFTIVAFAAPGVQTPYVAATVDLGGTKVAGNIVGGELVGLHVGPLPELRHRDPEDPHVTAAHAVAPIGVKPKPTASVPWLS